MMQRGGRARARHEPHKEIAMRGRAQRAQHSTPYLVPPAVVVQRAVAAVVARAVALRQRACVRVCVSARLHCAQSKALQRARVAAERGERGGEGGERRSRGGGGAPVSVGAAAAPARGEGGLAGEGGHRRL